MFGSCFRTLAVILISDLVFNSFLLLFFCFLFVFVFRLREGEKRGDMEMEGDTEIRRDG